MSTQTPLDKNPQSIGTHLGFLQRITERMAEHSKLYKMFSVFIVLFTLICIVLTGKIQLVWIAIVFNIALMLLDAYYLALEKGFREKYESVVQKIGTSDSSINPIFALFMKGKPMQHRIAALKSFSIWGFHPPLMLFMVLFGFALVN